MCKLGDIIVVNKYIGDDNEEISKHSFVVINDKPGFIEGLKYDLITNVMSSFKSEEQRIKKLKFEENVEILSEQIISKIPTNKKNGFIKADQLIYFNKNKLDYYVLGHISDELLEELIMIIISLSKNGLLKQNISNIQEYQYQKQNWHFLKKMI